jgi:GNAT superfamily N-acetyltransferase
LIQIAHPKFRDDLLREAVAGGLLPAYQRASPPHVEDLGDIEAQKLKLRGEAFLLRPLRPSDIRRLQEFFYSHTLETIQMRYGFAVTRMTRERAYDLVNVDPTRDLALALFETQGPRQIIHAVGRYYLDANERSAEVAFVVRETKRRLGLASTLLDALVAVARKRGLDFLWGHVRKDNLPMLALFKRFGGKIVASPETGDDAVAVRIALRAAATSESAERRKRPGSRARRRG